MKINKENEIISIQHESVGSIKHYVSLQGGRCTFYADTYMHELCRPSLNVAATYDEVEKMRDVFNEILTLMKKGMPEEKKAKKIKHPCGKKGYLITLPNDKKISVLDFSDVLKSAPKILKESGVYMGWEAWDGTDTFRGDSFEEVENLLKKKYTLNY